MLFGTGNRAAATEFAFLVGIPTMYAASGYELLKTLKAAKLGDFPFTYDVQLTLDGETYRATATYPDDAEDQSIAVPLEFEPSLP